MIFSSFAIFSLALSPSGISGIEFSEQVWYGEEIAVRIPLSPLFYLAPQAFLVVFAVLLRCQCSEDVISKVALDGKKRRLERKGLSSGDIDAQISLSTYSVRRFLTSLKLKIPLATML